MKKGHIFYSIFFVIAAAVFIPLLFSCFYSSNIAKRVLQSEREARIQRYVNSISKEIDSVIADNKTSVQMLLSAYEREAKRNTLSNMAIFMESAAFVNGISIVNTEGKEITYLGSPPRFDYSDILDEALKTALENRQIFIGPLRRNAYRKQLLLKAAYPLIPAVSSQPTGLALAEFNMQGLGSNLNNFTGDTISFIVFTKSGFLIFSSNDGLITSINDGYKDRISSALAELGSRQSLLVTKRDKISFTLVNSSTEWVINAQTAMPPVFALFETILEGSYMSLIIICAVGLAFIIISSMLLTGAITRPLKIMTQAVNMVEAGEVNNLPPLPIPDNEVGSLSIAFARMLDSIKLKIDALAQEQQDLEEINQSLEIRVGSRTKELRTALNELIKKERLAAIGQMASIVSHEIRNPLAVMANSLYLIKARAGENADPRILKNITIIEQEIKQANGIIEEILGYARSRDQILTTVDINLYVKEILSSYPIPPNITVTADYEAPPRSLVRIDTEEMKQALRNIMGNAIEVMPAGGSLMVKTKEQGETVTVSIRDSGPGIPKDIQEKIFNPFFTTKARGTGLGLAVVKKVASRNNADIILQSEEGKGTKVSIVFKLQKGEAQ